MPFSPVQMTHNFLFNLFLENMMKVCVEVTLNQMRRQGPDLNPRSQVWLDPRDQDATSLASSADNLWLRLDLPGMYLTKMCIVLAPYLHKKIKIWHFWFFGASVAPEIRCK